MNQVPNLPDPANDPVLAKRAKIAKMTNTGKRLGYSLFGLAIVLFFVGLAIDYTDTLVTIIVACLIGASVVLVPAIIFGYGVRAADRADLGLDDGH